MKNVTKISARLVVALLVSACSGAPVAPATSTGAAAHRETPNGGGAFTAKTSGNYTFSDCNASANGHLKFRGSGRASYLHRVNESGAVKGKNYPPHCVWSGTATLTSRHHKMDSVTFSLGLNGSRYSNPCNNALGYVVKRGTGKFAKASGYGTVAFSCTDSGYLATWSGTLTY